MCSNAVIWVAEGTPWEGANYGTPLQARLAEMGIKTTLRYQKDGEFAEYVPATYQFLSGGDTRASELSPESLALTRTLIQHARNGECNLTGIALGSLMIAEALFPGSTRPSDSIEAGLTEIIWSGTGYVLPTFHTEEIEGLRVVGSGLQRIATNSHTRLQAYHYGRLIHGFQFHPEMTPDDMHSMVHWKKDIIENNGGDAAAVMDSLNHYQNQWSKDTFQNLPIFNRVLPRSRPRLKFL